VTYDPREYWTSRPPLVRKPAHEAQETALMDAIGRKQITSILEVGVGDGRIGRLLTAKWPGATYAGVDISPARAEEARAALPDYATVVESDLFDLDVNSDDQFDLVVAVEVLMHVKPEDVEDAVTRLATWSGRHVYTVDWDTPVAKTPADHNFLHDYAALGLEKVASVGRQGIYHLKV
jgi:trans-aconitate methyltransferase